MNAIILAAGMGTRLRPFTDNTPKPLVKVNGQPIIERQIEYLREIGIEEIIVVTGYLSEKFNYLHEKYNIKLVCNEKYDEYNNAYTMYLVREYLQDSIVLEGDVYLMKNFLLKDMNQSTYFSGIKEDFSNEWVLKFNEQNQITDINIDSGTGYIMSGISYWSTEDGEILNKMLEEMNKQNKFKDLFWDSLVKNNLRHFNIEIHKIESNDWVEIDSVEDMKKIERIQKSFNK